MSGWSPDAYGAVCATDCMEPRIRRDWIMFMDPAVEIREDDDVLLLSGLPGSGDVYCLPRRLVRITEKHWIVKMFKPQRRQKLSRRRYPIAHSIVCWRHPDYVEKHRVKAEDAGRSA